MNIEINIDVNVGGGYMAGGIYDTLRRAILRKNYTTKEQLQEQISILYAGEKITPQQYMELMELFWKGGDE